MRAKKMPFGKYRGCPVEDLPEGYLNWLIENVDLREPLRTAVYDALERQWNTEPATMPAANNVKTVYRKLARKYHPDTGGSTQAMQAINEFYEELTRV